MKSINDFEIENKRVLVRCDFNVPIDQEGNVIDDTKIKEALPTLQYLIAHQAKIIIVTHLGEPEGKIVEVLKLDNVKQVLEKLLGFSIEKNDDCIGKKVQESVDALEAGKILLLENVRFHKEEMENNLDFAKQLSQLADVYINEAFDVCHRLHASVAAITEFLPSGAGFALQKEVEVLTNITQRPERPMVAIIGGAKVSTKAKLVSGFCAFADLVIINGLIKQELITKKIPLEYPEKVFGPKENLEGLDITPEDAQRISEKILHAKTIFWNGAFGKFEEKEYEKGTLEIANAIIQSGAFSVVGGGETIEFLRKEGMLDKFNHVSTAGGAMLSFLAGEELPGLKALN